MTVRTWAEIVGAVALVTVAGIAWERARAARADALRADQAEANADTTRQLAVHAVRDRIVWQRRAVQQAQRADAIDAELRLTRQAYVALEAEVVTLRITVHGQTGDLASNPVVRQAHFEVRQEPYTASADVRLPPPPGLGDLELTVALDSLLLDLRLECGPAGVGGVRPASALVSGPPWARVTLSRVEQAVDVCSPPPPLLPSLGGFWRGARVGLVAGGAAGFGIALLGLHLLHVF